VRRKREESNERLVSNKINVKCVALGGIEGSTQLLFWENKWLSFVQLDRKMIREGKKTKRGTRKKMKVENLKVKLHSNYDFTPQQVLEHTSDRLTISLVVRYLVGMCSCLFTLIKDKKESSNQCI
jgi:hypothetical protein